METLCSPFVEETSFARTEDEDEAEENEEEDKGNCNQCGLCVWLTPQYIWNYHFSVFLSDDAQTEESADRKQRLAAWPPCFYCRMGKEVYSYAGHEIVIEEGLDSFAGMIWPGVSAGAGSEVLFFRKPDIL